MHLQHSAQPIINSEFPDIWETINRLQASLGLSENEIIEMLELTQKQFRRLRSLRLAPNLHSASAFTEKLDLNLEDFLAGSIHFPTLYQRHIKDSGFIDEKYQVAAFSKKRTILNLLDSVQMSHGWRLRLKVLRKFHMTEAAFQNPDAPVNIRLVSDFMEYLGNHFLSRQDFEKLGAHSVITNRGTSLHRELENLKFPALVYERMVVDLVGFYEKNCTYRLKSLGEGICVVESHPDESVASALNIKNLGNTAICAGRAGILSSTPGYIGLPSAQVIETHCIHRGDSACRFTVDFRQAHRISQSLNKRHPH